MVRGQSTGPQTKETQVFAERGIKHAPWHTATRHSINISDKCSARMVGKLVETECALAREGGAPPGG